jgi:hypothetical protein
MGKFIDRFLNRKTSTDTAEAAEKVKHKQHLELMIAELEDMIKYWQEHPSYEGSQYCPVKNKLYHAVDYLRQSIVAMRPTKG